MEGKRLLRSVRLENLLSYGAGSAEFSLEPLNVLIGPNASGKSNLIEALTLLAAAPRDLLKPIREGGGVGEWLWKGGGEAPEASLEAVVEYPKGPEAIRHRLAFTVVAGRFELLDERIETESPFSGYDEPYLYYAYQQGRPVLNVFSEPGLGGADEAGGALSLGESAVPRRPRRLKREDVNPEQSILSQRRDPDLYPEITYLASRLSEIRFFREWNLGRHTSPRVPQKVDLPQDFLLEDASNLGLVLNSLLNDPGTKRVLLEKLHQLYEEIEDVTTLLHGGTVQVFFHERGLRQPVPATRLSDGTLRYLCLLTILCHPNPPPLVCIEEPELGLHPDALPAMAEMMITAAERTQLIVTTHSDALVSALSDEPEAVVITERTADGTQLRRLRKEQLSDWLASYRLGELWQMGELGGTRW